MSYAVNAVRSLALVASLVVSTLVAAQDFPVRALRIVQGSAPGGNADTAARVLAAELTKILGQPVVVETRAGAAGIIAAEAVAKAPADGYTLLLVTGGHATLGAVAKSLPYDTLDGFAWVSTATFFPFLLVVRSDSAVQSLPALLELARAKPGTVTFGSSGTGATLHLLGELLGRMAEVKIVHVPYKGEAQAMIGLLAGDISFNVATPTTAVAQINAGKIRAIATTGRERWKGLPDVPTVAETAVPGYDVRSWMGIATTAGTPRPIVGRLNDAMLRALQAPEVRERFEAMGGEARGSSPDEMREHVRSEVRRWSKLVDDAGLPKQ